MVAINLSLLQPGSEPSGLWIGALEFNRQAVLHGQLWRLVTGSLVHWSREHFFLDAGAFLIVGVLYERHLRRSYPWILLASGVAVGCGVLWFRPDMAVYRGLSGVDSGQFAAAILVECGLAAREPRRWIWVLPVAGVFAFKIFYECLSGQLLFGTESLGAIGVPTPVAHAAGAATALAFAAGFNPPVCWAWLPPVKTAEADCFGGTARRSRTILVWRSGTR